MRGRGEEQGEVEKGAVCLPTIVVPGFWGSHHAGRGEEQGKLESAQCASPRILVLTCEASCMLMDGTPRRLTPGVLPT